MALTYEPIATTTLTSDGQTITFSSIPQTYTDLRVVLISKGGGGDDQFLKYNGVGTSFYHTHGFYSTGATTTSYIYTNNTGRINPGGIYHDTTRDLIWTMDIFDYTSSNNYKTTLHTMYAEYIGNANGVVNATQVFSNASTAITSIELFTGNYWTAGGNATLYGILKA